MNCGHCLCLALVLYVKLVDVDCGVTVEQLEKTSEMIRSVCQPRVKITTEMADGIRLGKFPDDKSLKCYVQCVLEMSGVMKKNKLNYEAALKQMDKLLPDDIVDANKNGITQCKDAANGVKDACEAAFILVQCMYKNNQKFTFALLVKIVLFACALVVHAKPLTDEERQAMYNDLLTNCKAQEGASDADVQEAVMHQPPSTRSGQCLNACLMETVGMMKDSKLSVEGCIKVAEMTGDPARAKNVELVSRACESTVGTDRCDTAFQLMQCVAKVAVANGIDPAKELM